MLDIISMQIEEELLNLHTAGLAKIVRVNGNSVSIQPLAKVRPIGGEAQEAAVLEDVPVLEHVLYVASQPGQTPLGAGQTVMYVCCDREISQTKYGKMHLPSNGHHELGNAVIIGRLTV